MKRYSRAMKQTIIHKIMPPQNTPISQLIAETGISDAILYTWRKQARARGVAVPGNGKNAGNWCCGDKFAILLGTAALNEAEFAIAKRFRYGFKQKPVGLQTDFSVYKYCYYCVSISFDSALDL